MTLSRVGVDCTLSRFWLTRPSLSADTRSVVETLPYPINMRALPPLPPSLNQGAREDERRKAGGLRPLSPLVTDLGSKPADCPISFVFTIGSVATKSVPEVITLGIIPSFQDMSSRKSSKDFPAPRCLAINVLTYTHL